MKWLTYVMCACVVGATLYLGAAGVAGSFRPNDPVDRTTQKDIAQKPERLPRPSEPERRS